jgi:general secretion pathway protein E/type IV pilus assembly protein PilB
MHYDDSFLNSVGFPLDQKANLYAPVGCRNCRNTGFMGRLAIMEICMMTPPLAEKINAHAPVADMKAQALQDGMIPMRQYGLMKAAQGVTTLEEVLMVTAANE